MSFVLCPNYFLAAPNKVQTQDEVIHFSLTETVNRRTLVYRRSVVILWCRTTSLFYLTGEIFAGYWLLFFDCSILRHQVATIARGIIEESMQGTSVGLDLIYHHGGFNGMFFVMLRCE